MNNLTPDTKTLLKRVVDRTIAAAEPTKVHADLTIKFDEWQWHQGVALAGIVRAAERLGDDAYLKFAIDWVDAKIRQNNFGLSINTTAPLLAVARLFELTKRKEYQQLCEKFAQWCLVEAPRLPDGTFEHSCTENRYPLQVWADTLFMGCLFLARWGTITGNRTMLAEAARQFVQHYQYLADRSSGLIFHGYCGSSRRNIGVVWGRGNGWFSSASAEVAPLLVSEPQYAVILENLRLQLGGVLRTQGQSGAWHTVMDRPDTYTELSCTAAFAQALRCVARQGVAIPGAAKAGDAALAAVKAAIDEEGILRQASGGTPVMADAIAYDKIPYAPTCFSQGLAMLALAEDL